MDEGGEDESWAVAQLDGRGQEIGLEVLGVTGGPGHAHHLPAHQPIDQRRLSYVREPCGGGSERGCEQEEWLSFCIGNKEIMFALILFIINVIFYYEYRSIYFRIARYLVSAVDVKCVVIWPANSLPPPLHHINVFFGENKQK